MRKLISIIFLMAVNKANSGEYSDTNKVKGDILKLPLTVSGDVSFNSNGIASIS